MFLRLFLHPAPSQADLAAPPPPAAACAICLESSESKLRHELPCNHSFCIGCIGKFAVMRCKERASVCCPECMSAVDESSLGDLLTRAKVEAAVPPDMWPGEQGEIDPRELARLGSRSALRSRAPEADARRVLRAFYAWAQAHHVKLCPHCHAPIERVGGCSEMRCGKCKAFFSWDREPLCEPCAGFHFNEFRYPFFHQCKEMPPSQRTARGKATLTACRAGALVLSLPIALPQLVSNGATPP